MQSAPPSQSRLSAGLRTAAAVLLFFAIAAAGTALIVRCIVELAPAPAEVSRHVR